MIRNAATCDTAHCLAIFLQPDELTEEQSFEAAAAAAGWRLGADGHWCPACSNGQGPVAERGECPRCCGSTVDLPAGSACHYCGHVQPHPPGVDSPVGVRFQPLCDRGLDPMPPHPRGM